MLSAAHVVTTSVGKLAKILGSANKPNYSAPKFISSLGTLISVILV